MKKLTLFLTLSLLTLIGTSTAVKAELESNSSDVVTISDDKEAVIISEQPLDANANPDANPDANPEDLVEEPSEYKEGQSAKPMDDTELSDQELNGGETEAAEAAAEAE